MPPTSNLVEAGTVRLVEPNAEHIVREVSLLLSNADEYERMARNGGFARNELLELPPSPQRAIVSTRGS